MPARARRVLALVPLVLLLTACGVPPTAKFVAPVDYLRVINAATVTLRVHPAGPMRAVWSTAEDATSWSRTPGGGAYPMSFTAT